MRITQIQKDIDELSKLVLESLGFDKEGSIGESFRISETGKQAILLDCIKDRKAFSISVRVYLRYDKIESVYNTPESEYTISKVLRSESISEESYSKAKLKEIINTLISTLAMEFISKYATEQSIMNNLTGSDYRTWVTSDKVAQFKVNLAAATFVNDSKALEKAKEEALKYCEKPWSEHDREIVKKLCACV